jgi:hypothetical protein
LLIAMNVSLRDELLAMAAEDDRVHTELSNDGSIYAGYHPRLREIHERHALRLQEIIHENGWPGCSIVGDDGARAAWFIAQHAIALPAFLRDCLKLQERAAACGEIPGWQPAFLLDRIRMYEGKPQVYGTQFLPDENGVPSRYPVEDPAGVNDRRRSIGLEPIAEHLCSMRESAGPKDSQSSPRYAEWLRGYEAWLREVGWRS